MKQNIREIIDRMYFKGDIEFFVASCLKCLKISNDIKKILSGFDVRLREVENVSNKRIYLAYEPYIRDNFNLLYSTTILISKIMPLYSIQHGFEIDNIDEDRVSGILNGTNGQPYSKTQYKLHGKLKSLLDAAGFSELSYDEINEAVYSVDSPEGVIIYGHQLTFEQAFFNDLFDLCQGIG
jgi:predicted solute-binding protein